MSNILLTGSNGFIGSYFIDKYSLKHKIKTFSFLSDNIVYLNLVNIDVVVHLSALVHQMGGASKNEYERINVLQTLELAKKAKESGVKQFIFMSTIKVYGEETSSIYTENSNCNPEDEYGKSKLKAEIELKKLESADFKISIIRTPIVYGYGVKANIKSLISLVKNVPVLPFENIKNKRSMVYIGNLCHLLDTLISNSNEGLFIASDDSPISTTTLINLISNNSNKKVFLVELPFFKILLKKIKPSFYKRLYCSLEVDNSETKLRLNLKNPFTVNEGIEYMINGENK